MDRRKVEKRLKVELEKIKCLRATKAGVVDGHKDFLFGMLAEKSEIIWVEGKKEVVLSIDLNGWSHGFCIGGLEKGDVDYENSIKRAIAEALAKVIYTQKINLQELNSKNLLVTIP